MRAEAKVIRNALIVSTSRGNVKDNREFRNALYIYSFEMMVIGGKLGGDGEMLTFTVLIGRGESVSKARRDNSTTKGLRSH